MRVLAILACLLFLPSAVAEFGPETATGWPIGEGGFSHDPAVRFDPEYLAQLAAAATEPPLNQVGPATIYPYYPIVMLEVQRLADEFPEIVRLHTGSSTLGLELWTLEIGDFHRTGEAEFVPMEDRETVWVDGGTHSNEYSGVYFTLAVAQYLIESYGSDEFATWVVENRHTFIMPMLNPDGSHLMGRLNANLVNVNRNYPVLWGGDGTDALLNNPGPSAGSEVETQLSIDWYNAVQPDYMASIHCCGNLWLAPYGEEGYDPIDLQVFERVCDEAFPSVREACGPIWSTIYPASGSSVDTCYEYTGGVCYGYEMSGRSNLAGPWGEPFTFEDVFVQEAESWEGLRHALENVHRYGAHLATDVVDGRLRITNDGYGNATRVNVTWADGGIQKLHDLPAGESVELDAAGEGRIDYAKRVMQAPMAATTFSISGSETEATPAPALFLLLALVGLALHRRR